MSRTAPAESESPRTNEFGQPIGAALPRWRPARIPERTVLQGSFCRLVPLTPGDHAAELLEAFAHAPDARDWCYLPIERFESPVAAQAWAEAAASSVDPLHYAVIEAHSGRAVGTMALMRHDPRNGSIEVGWVNFSPLLQRTVASTEAHALLMSYAFDALGYRRYEWKCDSLNQPSRRAAVRLGFSFEGVFRNHVVVKGRNRDTAWYSIIEDEWPRRQTAFTSWLDPANFDPAGRQLRSLAACARDAATQRVAPPSPGRPRTGSARNR